MNFSKIDLFSSHFYFNIKQSQIRKGTLVGSILSIAIIILTFYYLGYLLNQYMNNLIDPNYKAQNYSNEDETDLEINEDLLAFRFESNYNLSVDLLEAQTNSTFIVYKVYFLYMNQANYDLIPIDFVKCKIPTLEGFYCLNLSNLSNKTLTSNIKNNIQSQIQINAYGCRDLDSQKTTVPNNCACQGDINNVINALNAGLRIKIKTSQYNTTSQQVQTSYRSTLIYTLSNQLILTTLKIQKQNTSIKQGYLFQKISNFTSPLSYNLENQSLDRQSAFQLVNIGCFAQMSILVDEIFQQIEIQYPTIPQILALVNSIFSVLMLIGFIGRKISLRSIKQDFFVFLLQNTYQDLYLKLAQKSNPKNKKEIIDQDLKYQDLETKQQTQQIQKESSVNQQLEQQINHDSEEQIDIQMQQASEQQIDKSQSINRSLYFKNKLTLDLKKQNSSLQTRKKTTDIFEVENDDQCDHLTKKKSLLKNKNSINNKQNNDTKQIKQIKTQQLIMNESDVSKFQLQNVELCNINNLSVSNLMNTQNNTSSIQQRVLFSPYLRVQQCRNSNIINNEKSNKSYIQQVQMIKDINISAKIQNMLFKKMQQVKIWFIFYLIFIFKCSNCNKKDDSILKFLELKKKKIECQIDKDLDIFTFYKDILFLKKAVSILLSKEQLASLQLVGCSSNFLEIDLNLIQDISNIKSQYQMTYYEEQFAIQKSDELQYKHILNFLNRCQRKQDVNFIDERIYSSMLPNQIN